MRVVIAPDELLEPLRARLGSTVRRFLTGQTAPPIRTAPGDDGLFGPGSATWVVHADLAMLVGGLRAVLLQTLHPQAMAAFADHSQYRADPLGRLHRTGRFLGATTYGTTAEADGAIAAVRAIHDRVTGVAGDGRTYSANDPHLLAWVHVTEVDSFLAAHQRYGRVRLGPADADRYVDEMSRVAARLGAGDVPRTVAGLRRWIDGVRPELAGSRLARDAARFVLVPPLPLAARAPYTVIAAAAVGLLPGWARLHLWLPPVNPASDRMVVRPACAALLQTLRWALQPPRGL